MVTNQVKLMMTRVWNANSRWVPTKKYINSLNSFCFQEKVALWKSTLRKSTLWKSIYLVEKCLISCCSNRIWNDLSFIRVRWSSPYTTRIWTVRISTTRIIKCSNHNPCGANSYCSNPHCKDWINVPRWKDKSFQIFVILLLWTTFEFD